MYLKKQDYDKAIESFKKVVELNPLYPKGHYNLGLAYVYKGEKEKAERELKFLQSVGSSLADALEKKMEGE